MNKRKLALILSFVFVFVFALGLFASCSSSKKASKCPAYGNSYKKERLPYK